MAIIKIYVYVIYQHEFFLFYVVMVTVGIINQLKIDMVKLVQIVLFFGDQSNQLAWN